MTSGRGNQESPADLERAGRRWRPLIPLVTISNSLALLFAVGSASCFSLELGNKQKDRALQIYGNGLTFLLICGKDYYPYLTEHIALEVLDEIAVVLSGGDHLCGSYKQRKRERGGERHLQQYSPGCKKSCGNFENFYR